MDRGARHDARRRPRGGAGSRWIPASLDTGHVASIEDLHDEDRSQRAVCVAPCGESVEANGRRSYPERDGEVERGLGEVHAPAFVRLAVHRHLAFIQVVAEAYVWGVSTRQADQFR